MVNALQMLAALAALILLHETGHFLACRLFKIEVEEFGIGFPPRLATLFERRGTKFTLNAVPLGGFVLPKTADDEDESPPPGSLETASPWARIGMYAAGPVMNLLVAVVLLTLGSLLYGTPTVDYRQVQILTVTPSTPAEQAGIQPCDIVTSLDGQPVEDVDAFVAYIQAHKGTEITIQVRRGEETRTILVTPRVSYPSDEGSLGVGIGYHLSFEKDSFFLALAGGVGGTALMAYNVAALPVRLISGALSYEEGRPVGLKGMVDIYSDIKSGSTMACTPIGLNVIYFLASISISLAVFNLLPFPALDGGRILFVLPELLIKRRIPVKYERLFNLLGFLILLFFLIVVNIQDFIHPVL